MKTRSVLLVLILLPALLCAQTIETSRIDMSDAQAFPAGPDRVYVRGIVYDGSPISVILAYDGMNGAEVLGPFVDGDRLITDDIDLTYASFTLIPQEALEISGVIIGGNAYRGLFARNGLSGLTLSRYDVMALPDTAETRLSRLETERTQLQERIAALSAERDKAVSELRIAADTLVSAQAAAARAAEAMNALALPQTAVFRGFRAGTALMGTWRETAGGIMQTDPAQKISAYTIAVPELSQIASDTLFSFRVGSAAAALGNGFGMHFAESDRAGDVYGFGDSFFLWVTANATGGAFLQLYAAGDRINQIASFRLGEKLPEQMELGLLYRPETRSVDLLVDGKRKAEFDAAIGLPGTTLVLRTFGGPVTFRDFTVQVK